MAEKLKILGTRQDFVFFVHLPRDRKNGPQEQTHKKHFKTKTKKVEEVNVGRSETVRHKKS